MGQTKVSTKEMFQPPSFIAPFENRPLPPNRGPRNVAISSCGLCHSVESEGETEEKKKVRKKEKKSGCRISNGPFLDLVVILSVKGVIVYPRLLSCDT